MLSAPVDLGHVGAQAHGNKLGRLQTSANVKNSVVTTISNNWYREPMVKKAKPYKNLERHSMAGHPDV